MLHSKRIWSISSVESAAALATKLAQYTWTGCQAFQLEGYIFANDASSGDGAQEYAVLKPSKRGDDLVQIESITFSWCTEVKALTLIQRVVVGDFDCMSMCHVSRDRFQAISEHGVCYLCA